MSIFDELKRRNVIRVAVAYIVAAWVLLQVADLFMNYVDAPDWVMHVMMFFVGIGFIAAVTVAWAYELTPEGIKREQAVDRAASVVAETGRKLDRIIIGFLAIAVVLLLTDRYLLRPTVTDSTPSAAQNVSAETPPIPEEATNSIAVLPFVNMSTDAENEFFSDGISEEILNVLASIPELKVAARTSAFAYKGSKTNISGIAKELGVNHVLEGSVRKAGSQVRITAQLIKADDGFHLWSANYDRELTNIFAIQDEIANAIADALKVSLKLNAGDSGNLTGTQNIAAYEHYLQGMSLWHLRTAVSLDQSIKEFESSIALDPQFAKAHAGLALAWAVIDGYINIDQKISSEKASQSVERALQLAPDNIEAMAAMAITYKNQRRYAESEALSRKAIALNPSFATAHQWYGMMLSELGDSHSALAEYRIAWSLDPRSRIIGYNLAYQLDSIGLRTEAIAQLDEVLGFAPDFPDANDLMMMLQMFNGDCGKASIYGHRLAAALKKPPETVQLYLDLCQTSDLAKRNIAIDTILSWDNPEFANPADPSLTYEMETGVLFMGLGLFDAFWTVFESSPEHSESIVPWIRPYRTENGIRVQCDPRFKARTAELGLPPTRVPIACPGP